MRKLILVVFTFIVGLNTQASCGLRGCDTGTMCFGEEDSGAFVDLADINRTLTFSKNDKVVDKTICSGVSCKKSKFHYQFIKSVYRPELFSIENFVIITGPNGYKIRLECQHYLTPKP